MIAHRGASVACPENTHAAFAHALRLGADGIELDLQLSRDGTAVVYHDRTLQKVGHGRRRVAEVDAAELATLDVGSWRGPRHRGERMPTLREVLDRYGTRTTLLLELKVEPEDGPAGRRRLVDATVDAIVACRLQDRVYVLSFDAALLRAVKRRVPALATVLDVSEAPPLRDLPRVLSSAHALCLPARWATAALADAARAMGRELWVYRCDTDRAFAHARRAGATLAMSDRPDWLRAKVEHGR